MFDKHLSIFGLVGLGLLALGNFYLAAPQNESQKNALTFSSTAKWDDYHLAKLAEPLRYPESLFAGISLPPPPSNASSETSRDLTTIKEYRALRTPEAIKDIVSEQTPENTQLGTYNLKTYMDGVRFPATAVLLYDSFHDVTVITLREKKKFDRVRPSALDRSIDTVIPIPGHPAYPAGHSAQTHFLAYVFSELAPARRAEFIERADQISKNRVIAGLHYPEDNVAGVLLAQQIFEILMKNERFLTLLAAAKEEWAMHPELVQARANP